MSLEIHLRLKDDKFLVQTLLICTQEVVFPEVNLQGFVVHIILLLPSMIPSVANMALFLLISAMCVQFVIAIESLPAEATLRVALETALIHGSRVVVAKFFMLAKFGYSEQLMFMREDFLVSRAQITHYFAMQTLDMPVKVRPSPTGNVTTSFGAVVSE